MDEIVEYLLELTEECVNGEINVLSPEHDGSIPHIVTTHIRSWCIEQDVDAHHTLFENIEAAMDRINHHYNCELKITLEFKVSAPPVNND